MVLVAVNTRSEPARVSVPGLGASGGSWGDLLNPGETFSGKTFSDGAGLELDLPPNWGRVLRHHP